MGLINMGPNEYQKLASRTLIDKPDFTLSDKEVMICWKAMGLAGEAGEVADLTKKTLFHRHPADRDKMIKELGDCLWYIAALCKDYDTNMEEVMQKNIDKLKARYPDGYSSEASINRVKE